jgi:hypothetical protein
MGAVPFAREMGESAAAWISRSCLDQQKRNDGAMLKLLLLQQKRKAVSLGRNCCLSLDKLTFENCSTRAKLRLLS